MIGIIIALVIAAFLAVVLIRTLRFTPKAQPAVAAPAAAEVETTDETDMAAIAYVLHTFYNQHDEESDILTFRHDDVAYSPWNQKSIIF